MTLAGTLDLSTADELHLAVSGGLTLQGGTIKLATDTIDFQGTQTLGGTGTVDFVGTNQYYGTLTVSGTAATLTIAPGVSIHGTSGAIEAAARPVRQPGNDHRRLTSAGSISTAPDGSTRARSVRPAARSTCTGPGATPARSPFRLPPRSTWAGRSASADLGTLNRSGGTVNLTGTLTNTGTLSLDATSGSWVLYGGEIVGGTVATAGVHAAGRRLHRQPGRRDPGRDARPGHRG